MATMPKVNILAVDDRPEGLVAIEAVLNDPSYNLVKANSGREALSHVLNTDFAVILMDVQMPEMDGFETASIIKQRERSKSIPIIFMTAINKSEHYVSMGYKVGAVDYLLKPFDPHILKSKVAVFVDLYRMSTQLREQGEVLRNVERRERVRTLAELELEGRRRYQNLADAIPQIVFRSNSDGEVEYFNQFWQLYTAATLKESIGRGWIQVIHPADRAGVEEKFREALDPGLGFETECRIRNGQTGEYRWHLLRVMPEFNQSSQLLCWIGTASDIQDQKRIQQELQLAKELADAASETKSRFLANMSHEIRTPLGVILGFAEILMNPTISPSEKLEASSAIRRNGEQLSRIIDEILDLSKVEAGKLDVERSDVHVIDLLNGVQTFMSLSAREKGLELEFVLGTPIPVRIQTNQTRLQQILVNVIGNAIKFSSRGKVRVTVLHEPPSVDSPSQLRLSVKDSGPGLTRKQIASLFQPFTQADTSTTRKYGGTGLGLALSRRLARELGGDIIVECNQNEGCDFIITIETGSLESIPFSTTLHVPKISDAVHYSEDSKKRRLQGIKILLVEDSVDNQILVSRFLSMEGAAVDLANNGLEGVAKAQLGDHHVVLMDIQMPELDGYGAISRLREGSFAKPIIALTAHGMLEERQRCLRVGANEHLTKPVNRNALIEQVKKFAAEGAPLNVCVPN